MKPWSPPYTYTEQERQHVDHNALQCFDFRFVRNTPGTLVQLNSIGIDERFTTAYRQNGLTRRFLEGHFIFQYTLTGFGAIRIGDDIHELHPGEAFFVKLHSDHTYYFPDHSESWAFAFINLYGPYVQECWQRITSRFGQVLTLDIDSAPIRTLLEVHRQASQSQIRDGYRASEMAYRFLMECCRHFFASRPAMKNWPPAIVQAVHYFHDHYAQVEGMEQLAEKLGLSKYHFLRLFRQYTGLTTVQYVTKIRMDQAVHLLRSTTWPVEQIAQEIGYAHSSYFCKVFRSTLGTTPHQFRANKDWDHDHITF